MHIEEGKIRAYLDAEMASKEHAQVENHLQSCPSCQERVNEVLARSQRVHNRIVGKVPLDSAPSINSARLQLETLFTRKENEKMKDKLFSKKYRPAWFALALVILAMIVISVPSIRVLANNFLGLFRVEQFTIVQIDPSQLTNTLGDSVKFEELISRNVQFDASGEPMDVNNLDDTADIAGFQPRLPTSFKDDVQLMVTPKTNISFQIDLKLIQGILDELDLKDVDLPNSIDGETVSVSVPYGVTASTGECEFDPETAAQAGYDPDDIGSLPLPNCTTFVQMPSPDVNAPSDLNIIKIGEAYLQLLGMTPDEASKFSSHIDWTTTLVIPIPLYGTRYEEVPVDGVTGTLILSEGNISQFLLMWVKDGMIYALAGPGNSSTALRIATSIE